MILLLREMCGLHIVWPAAPKTPCPAERVRCARCPAAVTGTKQWERPEGACALVHYSESSHMQPRGMQPASMAAAEAASNRARQSVGA